MTIDVRSLVDLERGLVSRRIFHDDDIYALEQERIFGRCWTFLGHEGQIRNSGDYLTCRIGETPVIVGRAAAGEIFGLINSCRHRGNPVTRTDAGNARTFTCPYHGWCYDLQGKRGAPGTLVGVPGHDSYYADRLDFSQWGLVPVAHVESYRGLIFGTLSADAPPLREYLGEFCWFLDAALGRGVLDVVPGVVRWRIGCNWKFAADNGVGDNAHAMVTHRSALMAIAKLRGRPAHITFEQEPGFTLLAEYGHGANCKTGVAASTLEKGALQLRIDPVFERWRNDSAIVEKLDPQQRAILRYNANVFPNLHINDRLFVVRNPMGPAMTEFRMIALYDTSGPPEMQAVEKRLAFQKFGPSGFYEQEDGENWDQSTAGASIEALASYDLHYGMGAGTEEFVRDGGPVRIESMVNEHAQRWFYGFWADALAASDWTDLRRNHRRPAPAPARS